MKKVLLTDCPDEKGLIAKITSLCYEHQLNIVKNNEFVDNVNSRFFMRTELEGDFTNHDLLPQLAAILPPNSHLRLEGQNKQKSCTISDKRSPLFRRGTTKVF
eukprot:TRINITY_DN3947_c0_g1_i1.p2 TRINITY_DN3947_c0_g1~~TRINITY_DN3947_c0_g1_i1.p2  ORF type:complete len:103 (+),score=6.44 TRINITY_DN3947_c0_g1_i1:524-832(+)